VNSKKIDYKNSPSHSLRRRKKRRKTSIAKRILRENPLESQRIEERL
jgi:hypothetical protein